MEVKSFAEVSLLGFSNVIFISAFSNEILWEREVEERKSNFVYEAPLSFYRFVKEYGELKIESIQNFNNTLMIWVID